MIAGVVNVPSENLMIIRGLTVFAAKPYRSFLRIFSCVGALFPEFSARDPLFFENPQRPSRSFFEIFGSRPGLFRKYLAGLA
ncbi:hypothetical protein [Methanoregula boonei]|jgi:hypothetical protein|uniref:hypothetical protein n=1 Tax=Methanoregula boonei TaxID=358766 RepID=UPI001E567456|nr:hypothetical protein [Methanoregula boonei]